MTVYSDANIADVAVANVAVADVVVADVVVADVAGRPIGASVLIFSHPRETIES